MQNICLLYSGRRGLDDQSTRISVLRIPEVSRKLKDAQRWIDNILGTDLKIDLYSFVQSIESDFNSQSSLKSLVAATVQIGLFERFVKYRSRPQFLVGPINGNSAMKVCAGLQNFQDFIETSDFCKENTLMARFTQQGTKLSGVKLEDYGALMWNPEGFYQNLEIEKKEATKIIEELNLHNLLTQCVHLGPTFEFRKDEFETAGLSHLASMSSIETDPILNSFWKSAI